MTVNQLRVFVTVAKHLNITRASRELRVSQPAVSRQLKRLAYELGVSLYRKRGQSLELTARGHSVLSKAAQILTEIENLAKDGPIPPVPSSETGVLTVGGSFGISASLLPSMLAAFSKMHPHVHFELRTAAKSALERLVLTDEVDLAVVTSMPRSPRLVVESYRTEPLVVFVAKDHPLAKSGRLLLRELTNMPLVIRGGGRRRSVVESTLRRAGSGLAPNIVMRCESPGGVKTAVRQKLGAGVLHYDLVRRDVQKGEYKVLQLRGIRLEARSYIIYDRDRPLSPIAKAFLELLRRDRRSPRAQSSHIWRRVPNID